MDDLAGKVFGYMTVLSLHKKAPNGGATWDCRCVCGVEYVLRGRDLKYGKPTLNCGCQTLRLKTAAGTKHGDATKGKTRKEYWVWNTMKQRCLNPNDAAYKDYGGRGIEVCERWLSYPNFIADMGPCPEGFSLERKDVDGPYSPSNCKWGTKVEQARNKRNTVWVEYGGKTIQLRTLAEQFGLSRCVVYQKWKRGVPLNVIFGTE